jgi:elongator complex protein 3
MNKYYMNIKQKAIKELLKLNIKSAKELMQEKRKIAKKYGIDILLNSEILEELRKDKKIFGKGQLQGREQGSALFVRLLRKRSIRTMSGIAPVAVLTMPYPCPGKCAYCPNEKNVPTSYLSNEPAVMRAIRCGYDPYTQVQARLQALVANGHEPTKIELIVIGGTWSVLSEKYKFWFISECFRGANEFNYQSRVLGITNYELRKNKKIKNNWNENKFKIEKLKINLEKEQKKNEKAKYKLIGVTLETRPDFIDEKEVLEMRELGCTRVELGVQALDDKILKLNKRGHGINEVAEATKLLKDYGFKVTYHIMPGLPGSTPAKDLKMFKMLFNDERFQPDQIKFYPTVVTKGSLLYKWWKKGEYKPYSDKSLQNLIISCKKEVPGYVRIIRLIRDIPGESIIAGNMITNLRQVMKDKGVECHCIRCREAREKSITNYELRITNYAASGGEEYFISAESEDGKVLYGFCRLRLSSHNVERITHNMLDGMALVRELHVYGELVSVGSKRKTQHAGLGKRLMIEAEKIAKKNGYKNIAVISGVGVRGYYRKLGYKLKSLYMVREVK